MDERDEVSRGHKRRSQSGSRAAALVGFLGAKPLNGGIRKGAKPPLRPKNEKSAHLNQALQIPRSETMQIPRSDNMRIPRSDNMSSLEEKIVPILKRSFRDPSLN